MIFGREGRKEYKVGIFPMAQEQLAARAEGLGCVLTTLLCICEPEVRDLLDIPEPWGTAAAIPIGYPVRRGHGPISQRAVEKLAFEDGFGTPLSFGGVR